MRSSTLVAAVGAVGLLAGAAALSLAAGVGHVDQPALATRPAVRGLQETPPASLGTCPAAVHDRFVVTGPDGRTYRTWHPQTVPVDPVRPSGPTCTFAHEHGDDPSTSLADPSPPPFGYAAFAAGMDEPHEGFKVFVVNAGTRNDEGRVARTSTRMVVHMGTGGPKRFTERHHSLEFDLIAPDGHEVHVQGMADTGLAGSICQRDASLSNSSAADDVGRAVVVVPGAGCDTTGALYEIWKFELDVEYAHVIASSAVFDPITVLDPTDPSRAVPTEVAYPRFGVQYGCDREAYHGPVYWYHATGPTTFWTDAMGMVVPAGTPGALAQYVSNHTDIGIPMNQDQSIMKLHRTSCAPGLGSKN